MASFQITLLKLGSHSDYLTTEEILNTMFSCVFEILLLFMRKSTISIKTGGWKHFMQRFCLLLQKGVSKLTALRAPPTGRVPSLHVTSLHYTLYYNVHKQ